MKTVQELITLRALISNICEDLQDYLNNTPVWEVEEDVVIRLLDLMKEYKAQYIDTDSVKVSCQDTNIDGCVPGYPEVRPDVYAPDPDDEEDDRSWRKCILDEWDLGEIEKTMEQPLDHNSRKPFRPRLEGMYRLAGTRSIYECTAIDDVYHTCTMRNIDTGWACDAHDIGIYNNYSIDWSHSTNGHFEKE